MQTNKLVTQTVWTTDSQAKKYPSLTADISVDVVIVGAGITGITAAYLLAAAGKQVAVLESRKIAEGTTGSSTGNLYVPVGIRLHRLKSKHSSSVLEVVAKSRKSAIDFIAQQVHDHRIDCGFHRVPWHLFTTSESKSKDRDVKKEFETVQSIHLQASNIVPADFPIKDVSAITTVYDQAQMNALSYVQGLANKTTTDKCLIFEDSPVINVEENADGCIAYTKQGKVHAKKMIIATHSPKGIYGVHAAMEAHREYMVAAKLKAALPPSGIYWHVLSAQQYSIRPYSNETGHYLLALGEPHLVGSKEHNEESFTKISNYLQQHFDVETILYRWAAQNYKPADGLPYIGLTPMQKHTFIATGFAADGLVFGTVAAMIISDTIIGKKNDWADVYDPKRFTPIASAGQFLKENITVASHLLKDYLFYGEVDELKGIRMGEGKTLKLDGEKVAAYRDEHNQLHVVSSICTHMGCVVHWNHAEKSWDCPCHGSRFSIDGQVLEGPAIKSLATPSK
jgi:glycine/D-amino acid oxidase-like deaminating enzyme/nitrite reductase/ring-hydroxylating ferredoxin subunit